MGFRRLARSSVLLAGLLTASPFRTLAQRGDIHGIVSDQTSSAIPGVEITALNLDRGLKREAATGEEGRFSFPCLQPGRYVLTAQKEGFSVAEVETINLRPQDTLELRIVLRVGSQAAVIRVTDVPELQLAESPGITNVVSGEVLRNTPVASSEVTDVALLQAGVIPTNEDSFGAGRYNIAGARSDSVAFLLDGGLNNDLLDNRLSYAPPLDAVAEFRVMANGYPADYGRNSGGIVSMVTKSGTEQWHGEVFDFLRNDRLNANSFFNKSTPESAFPRDSLRENRFGATLGGPLLFPGLTKGKHKAFFFVAYEGIRQAKTATLHNPATAYTSAELAGDFSQAAPNGGVDPGVACFLSGMWHNSGDPSLPDGSPCIDATGNLGVPHPFFQPDPIKAFNGIIDPSRIDPVARKYIASSLIPSDPSGVITSQGRSSVRRNGITAKLDFDLSESSKLSATLGISRSIVVSPFAFADVSGFPTRDRVSPDFLHLSYTRAHGAAFMNEFRATVGRDDRIVAEPAKQLPTPAQLGIHIQSDNPSTPASLIFSSGMQIGFPAKSASTFVTNTFGLSDSLSWRKNSHLWTFGGGVSTFQNNMQTSLYVNGQFFFFGTGSQNDLADFLLGLPSYYTQGPAAPSNIRSRFSYGFAQDEWHLTRKFTLTLGLRYEYSTPKLDTENRLFSILPGHTSVVFRKAPIGMVFPGDRGVPRGVNYPDRNNWAPRISFAWDPSDKATLRIRGGFGVFYDILKAEDNLQFNGQNPFFSSAELSFNPLPPDPSSSANYLSRPYEGAGVPDPFPSSRPQHNIDFAAAGFLPIGGFRTVYVVDPHLRTPYTYQYNLSLQKELTGSSLLEIDYVGSTSHGLTSLVDINPFVLGTTDRVLNLTPGNSSCTSSDGSCSFANILEFKNISKASYNGLVMQLRKQFSQSARFGGSYLNLAYTFSHSIDNASGFQNRNSQVPYYNPNQFRASSDFDVRHRIVLSGGWNPPFEHYLPSLPKRLTEGWGLYPIVNWRTGFPIDVFANLLASFDFTSPGPSATGDINLIRANLTGPIHVLDPRQLNTFQGNTGNYWFDPTSFSNAQCNSFAAASCVGGPNAFPSDAQVVADPSQRTYGTLPRNFFRGPSRFNVDMAVSKKIPFVGERVALELRAEFFNLFNHAQFANPNANINDNLNFGQIHETADPRIIQLALRVSF
jgi:hypothetical protein